MSPQLTRRTFVTTSAGAVFATALTPEGYAAGARGRKRAYVVVVDGCKPDELTATLTPTLAGLRAGGLNYPAARSLPIMETIPNHVMMMSGLRPDKTGVPANVIYDRVLGDTRTLNRPRDLKRRTVIERLNRGGFTTATVLSKEYLVGIFGKRATYRWVPDGYIPISGHVPDQVTMDATLSMIEDHDPNLVFVNLGDVDRVGHSDFSAEEGARLARQTALADTDQQVSRLVDQLKSSGAWQHSLVLVLADHSMDWSPPEAFVSVGPALEADPFLAGKVAIAENGGAELLYWLGSDAQRTQGGQADARRRDLRRRRAARPRPDPSLPAARSRGRRRGALLQGRSPVRGGPRVEPDPGQPRSSRHPTDPVLPRRRPPRRTASRFLLATGAHPRRRADALAVLRRRRTSRRVRRRKSALTSRFLPSRTPFGGNHASTSPFDARRRRARRSTPGAAGRVSRAA